MALPRPRGDHADAARGGRRDDARSSAASATPRRCTPSGRAARRRRRGVPRDARRRARRPAERGRLHRRRHRGGQPRGQGPLLGPPRRRPAPPPRSWPARSSTTRCSTPSLWLAEHEGAEVEWLPVDAHGRVAPRRRSRPRWRADPDVGRAGHGDVGQQRGRHGPADRRARRRSRTGYGVPVPHRRGAGRRPAAASTSPRSGLDALTRDRAQDRRPARRRRAAARPRRST